MEKILHHTTALVTGGTAGIGRAAAILLAQAGAGVAVIGRRADAGAETVAQIRAAGGEGLYIRADITRAADIDAAVRHAVQVFGGIDIAFNSAGVDAELLPFAQDTEANFQRVFNTNVRGTWLSLQYEIRQMLKQGGGGSIINNSSVYGARGAYLNAN
jgi:NAD(P)-dependent dehydrogenase (short-subunit alcohol dehydrogenase family)